jgi:hypothetical protein
MNHHHHASSRSQGSSRHKCFTTFRREAAKKVRKRSNHRRGLVDTMPSGYQESGETRTPGDATSQFLFQASI